MTELKKNWIYWALTLPFGLFAIAGLAELLVPEQGAQSLGPLGYPTYLIYILGAAKLIGGITVLFGNRFPTLKDWAYAGFAIEFVGALISHVVMGGTDKILLLIPTLAITFASHQYWLRRVRGTHV